MKRYQEQTDSPQDHPHTHIREHARECRMRIIPGHRLLQAKKRAGNPCARPLQDLRHGPAGYGGSGSRVHFGAQGLEDRASSESS